jgi:hypothetical protein
MSGTGKDKKTLRVLLSLMRTAVVGRFILEEAV